MPAPRKYSDELRERAVRLVFDSGRPVSRIAQDLGIHKEALRKWVRQADAAQAAGDPWDCLMRHLKSVWSTGDLSFRWEALPD